MNTRNLLRKLPSCLLGAIFAAGIASTTVNAVDGNPPGLFELDANTLDDLSASNPGDDWSTLYNGGGHAIVTTKDTRTGSPTFGTPIVSDPAPLSIFTQGGSKDINDVSAWKHTDGAVPDKDDITNAYAAGYTVSAAQATTVHHAGDLIVYFGLDRLANNGDANAGFWFFQNEVVQNANGTFVDGDGNLATHVAMRDDPNSSDPSKFLPGDVFVIVKYPQGSGAIPVIKIYEWDPNDADGDKNFDPTEQTKPPKNVASPLDLLVDEENAECDGSGGKLACAITNNVDNGGTLSNEPLWFYEPKSGSVDSLPFESFYEGGINITKLLGTTPCFASFLAETRSSESQTAQLKDFVLSGFPVCGAAVEKACTAAFNHETNDVTVTFTGNALNTGGQSEYITLQDSHAASEFDSVCFDNDNNQVCDNVVPPAPTDLTALGDDTISFTLGAGKRVYYQGHYTAAPGTSFSDTMTLGFSSGSGQPELGSDTATATCPLTLIPDVAIAKVCGDVTIESSNGSVVIRVGNTITVTNEGEEALNNVVVTDSEVQNLEDPDLAGTVWTCTAATANTPAHCTGSLAFGASETFTQTYIPDTFINGPDPGTVEFVNTATVTAEGAISGTPVVPDAGDPPATASCPLCP